jgi:hypothetical protein
VIQNGDLRHGPRVGRNRRGSSTTVTREAFTTAAELHGTATRCATDRLAAAGDQDLAVSVRSGNGL